MGIFDKFRQIFKKTEKDQAIESDLKRSNSDLKRLNERSEALQSDLNSSIYEEKDDEKPSELTKLDQVQISPSLKQKISEPIELQKESLQLGVAAGYTGKSIREIESSLSRIETQMISKDWMLSRFGEQGNRSLLLLSDIKNTLEKHDINASKRFNAIESALNRMVLSVSDAPEPIRRKVMDEIESIRTNLPLTPRMESLVSAVKASGTISYDDLAVRLGITRSALRGLLSNTIKRTAEIERISKSGKGWARYKYPKTTQIDTF